MKTKITIGILLTLLLTSIVMLAFNIQQAKASGTIYIRANGSIDPPDAPISSVDNITYTFTANIYDSIGVERDNIVVDGAGYTVQGTAAYGSKGIDLSERSNVTVKNTNIKDFSYGILLDSSNYNSISGNNITNNRWGGIGLWGASNNTISGNHIANNSGIGIELTGLFGSSNNSVVGNVLVNDGLYVWDSYRNVVVDNLVNGKPLVYLEGVSDVVVEDAGQVILVNCNRVKVENLNLSNTYIGVQLWRTRYTTISENNITNNSYGIRLDDSSNNNSISGNTIANNSEAGIRLTYGIHSKYNSIVGNHITNNNYGIESGAENSISGNTITNNSYAVYLDSSYYSVIVGNQIANNSYGISLGSSSNYNSISENNITANNVDGIWLDEYSNYNSISGNNITNNGYGISLSDYSNYNSMYGNNITKNYYGIGLHSYSGNNSISANTITANLNDGIELRTYNNTISENTIKNNFCGIWLYESSNNSIYHNNFIITAYTDPWGRRYQHVYTQSAYPNFWDDGYPSGGNYWSNYTGVDLHSGSDQDETGSDGIGDTTHEIDADNRDRYPLMAPVSIFDAGIWNGTAYNIDIVSNSTISVFQLNAMEKLISFNVTGPEFMAGFCRVTIPNVIVEDLWQGNYTVLLNGESWPFRNSTDATNTYIYVNYTHSGHQIIIIPEFPSAIVFPLFMIFTLVAFALRKKRGMKHQKRGG